MVSATTVSISTMVIALLAGLMLQWLVLQVALRPVWLVTPNARSSHTAPTPTMGGIAIVLVVLVYLGYMSFEIGRLGWGLLFGCGVLAGVGLWDDVRHVSAKFRIVVHILAAALVIWSMALSAPFWLLLICLFGLVWFINLYNFMDGIDGIAAAQCLVFCVGVEIVSPATLGWVSELLWVLSGAT
ncbi:MAG: hypothetical protein GXP16_19740, partial [Gammaproteobacteria bacterium]|nr:hypothetical protein [Gammaproteobacteria bacterium]